MTVQTSYSREIGKAFAGLMSGVSARSVRAGKSPSRAGVYTVTIDTVDDTTLYTITVNGVVVSFTSDADATEAEINAGLIAAFEASAFASELATIEAGATTATLVITGKLADDPLTLAVSAELSVATTTAPGENLFFGRYVAIRGVDTTESNGLLIGTLEDANSVLGGVLAHSHAQRIPNRDTPNSLVAAFTNQSDENYLLPGDIGSVMEMGDVWVEAEEAMAPGDGVFVRHTAGNGGSNIGRVRNDADTATAVQDTRASVVRYDADTGLVLLSRR